MPRIDIVRESKVQRSPRVMQIESMFDVPSSEKSRMEWHLDIDLSSKPWNVGLIVGPSGAGKSTLARELFANELVTGFEWSPDRAIVDSFDKKMATSEIVQLLSSVGFSSPPSWLRPPRGFAPSACSRTGSSFASPSRAQSPNRRPMSRS